MIYRLASVTDWPAIAEYVNGRDYFMPVDLSTLGGHWAAAFDDVGAVHGTLWFFGEAPNAYVGYWAAETGLVAAKLGSFLATICKSTGIQYVRGEVSCTNNPARRMATELFDMIESEHDYKVVFRSFC